MVGKRKKPTLPPRDPYGHLVYSKPWSPNPSKQAKSPGVQRNIAKHVAKQEARVRAAYPAYFKRGVGRRAVKRRPVAR